jgi:hypothetical protein
MLLDAAWMPERSKKAEIGGESSSIKHGVSSGLKKVVNGVVAHHFTDSQKP